MHTATDRQRGAVHLYSEQPVWLDPSVPVVVKAAKRILFESTMTLKLGAKLTNDGLLAPVVLG